MVDWIVKLFATDFEDGFFFYVFVEQENRSSRLLSLSTSLKNFMLKYEEETKDKQGFYALNEHLVFNILNFLEPNQILNCAQICKFFKLHVYKYLQRKFVSFFFLLRFTSNLWDEQIFVYIILIEEHMELR